MGLGPVGQFASRIGKHRGLRVIGVDPVPERRAMAERHGVETLDYIQGRRRRTAVDDRRAGAPTRWWTPSAWKPTTRPVASFAQHAAGLLPDKLAQKAIETAGVDRLAALHTALDAVRRGGTSR